MTSLKFPKPLPNRRPHWSQFVAFACFVLVGVFLAIRGEPIGWISAVFFGACLLVLIFEDELEPDEATQKISLLRRMIGVAAFSTVAAIGIMLIVADIWFGWLVAVVFGFGAVAFLADPWLSKRQPAKTHHVVITEDTIGCEYPRSDPESIRWDDVARVMLFTTSDGPWSPDMWLLFVAVDKREFPIPAEAEGFGRLFGVLKTKLPGFGSEPFVVAGTDDAQYICWERDCA